MSMLAIRVAAKAFKPLAGFLRPSRKFLPELLLFFLEHLRVGGRSVIGPPACEAGLFAVGALEAKPLLRLRWRGRRLLRFERRRGKNCDHCGHRMADEYAAVCRAFDYDVQTMEQLSLDGIAASFAPKDEQKALVRRFEADFDVLRSEFGLSPR